MSSLLEFEARLAKLTATEDEKTYLVKVCHYTIGAGKLPTNERVPGGVDETA